MSTLDDLKGLRERTAAHPIRLINTEDLLSLLDYTIQLLGAAENMIDALYEASYSHIKKEPEDALRDAIDARIPRFK